MRNILFILQIILSLGFRHAALAFDSLEEEYIQTYIRLQKIDTDSGQNLALKLHLKDLEQKIKKQSSDPELILNLRGTAEKKYQKIASNDREQAKIRQIKTEFEYHIFDPTKKILDEML